MFFWANSDRVCSSAPGITGDFLSTSVLLVLDNPPLLFPNPLYFPHLSLKDPLLPALAWSWTEEYIFAPVWFLGSQTWGDTLQVFLPASLSCNEV